MWEMRQLLIAHLSMDVLTLTAMSTGCFEIVLNIGYCNHTCIHCKNAAIIANSNDVIGHNAYLVHRLSTLRRLDNLCLVRLAH